MTLWLLGTQLDRTAASLDEHDRVLLIEASGFADRRPYHPHKLTLVFAAMRQFRDDVRARGLTVDYRQADTFAAALDAHFAAHPGDHLTMPRPAAHGAESRLRALVDARGGTLSFVRNPTFLLTPAEFDEWAESRNTDDPETYRLEGFYRHMRRESGVLMDGDEPAGGEWNYDDQNRETPPDNWEPPDPPLFEPDATTREVASWVDAKFETFVDPDEAPPVLIVAYAVDRAETSGDPVAGSDADDARFFTDEQLSDLDAIEPGYREMFRRAIRDFGDPA